MAYQICPQIKSVFIGLILIVRIRDTEKTEWPMQVHFVAIFFSNKASTKKSNMMNHVT